MNDDENNEGQQKIVKRNAPDTRRAKSEYKCIFNTELIVSRAGEVWKNFENQKSGLLKRILLFFSTYSVFHS